jgi:predicted DNA binding CopG/RHH family protein
MKSTRKPDIKFGKKDLLAEDEFDPKYGKERITILLDQQVVDAFRKKAKSEGKKYQALIRDILKAAVFSNDRSDLEKRLEKVEAVLFKKHA